MSDYNSKFKKGDLVEVIGSTSFPEFIGERFVLSVSEEGSYQVILNKLTNIKVWESPFRVEGITRIGFIEEHLKKINPDTDEKSTFTFEELMNKMKSGELEGVE